MARDNTKKQKGRSLAKGPVGLIGLGLLVFGVLSLIFGGNGFSSDPVDGAVNGQNFLGFEGNGWSNLLTAGAGALLVFAAPTHWGAKSVSLIVGLVLGAASVIALADGVGDVFGIFAANGPTTLLWGAASAALIILALLPRIGKKRGEDDAADRDRTRDRERVVERERLVTEPADRDERVTPGGDRDVVASASRESTGESVRSGGAVAGSRVQRDEQS